MKTCRICGVSKPRSAFGVRKAMRDGLRNECKPCHSGNRSDPEKVRTATANRKRRNPGREYGLSPEQTRAMINYFGGRCGICDVTPVPVPKFPNGWVIDHDHQTGAVRGILCPSCNTAIGLLKEDPFIIAQALNWVEKSGAHDLLGLKPELSVSGRKRPSLTVSAFPAVDVPGTAQDSTDNEEWDGIEVAAQRAPEDGS